MNKVNKFLGYCEKNLKRPIFKVGWKIRETLEKIGFFLINVSYLLETVFFFKNADVKNVSKNQKHQVVCYSKR